MSSTSSSPPRPTVPLYELAVVASGVDLEVRVNDVPVMHVDGGHVETKFDVNPHVVTGMNHLGMVLKPAAGAGEYLDGARAQLTLTVAPPPGPATDEPIAEAVTEQGGTLVFEADALRVPPPPDGIEPPTAVVPPGPGDEQWERAFASSSTPQSADAVIAASGVEASARIPINLLTPFTPWSWLTADTLPDDQDTFDQVMGESFRLWGLIKTKKLSDLEAIAAAQADDWMTAYGLADRGEAQRILGITETLSDPEVKPEPFPDPGALHLQVVGFGKLAHLIDGERKGPIRLGVKGMPHMTGRFVALFCRHGDTWTMIR